MPSFRGGQLGSALEGHEELKQEVLQQSGGRWWYEVASSHVLAKMWRHDVAEMLVETDLLSKEARAIRKAGAVLVITKDSFWKQQFYEAT